MALHFAHYNVVRVRSSSRVTPARRFAPLPPPLRAGGAILSMHWYMSGEREWENGNG